MDTCDTNEFGQWSRSSEDILRNRYPLHRSCRDGDIESLSILLVSAQHNLLQEDEFYGWTPAHWASYFGQLVCLRKIMQVLSVEPSTSRYQQTPAHLAAFAGHPHCLQWLVRTGSNIQLKDYMGETPVHKAARTGSMECLSLMAADNADLSIASNSGMNPASLAARCGYVDCALYLQRAAEQQCLKRTGVIDDVVLPVLPTEAVLPGQKPDKCVITQGINGGRLPNSIDSGHIPDGPTEPTYNGVTMMDSQMISNGFTNGFHHDNGLNTVNGFNHQNGFSGPHMEKNRFHSGNNNGFHVENNGFSGHLNGFNTSSGLQKDIMLLDDFVRNRLPVAGRKRGREEVDDGMTEEMKRVKRLEAGDGPGQLNLFGVTSPVVNVPHDSNHNNMVEEMDDGVQFMQRGETTPYNLPSGPAYSDHIPVVREKIFYNNRTTEWRRGSQLCSGNSSIDEHQSCLVAQQGYDSMLIETMLLECHGA